MAAAKVVIVDDSVSVCKAIERMLRPREIRVVGIHSGEEALARLEGERPDLVLCDLVLPDREGVEICRFVRQSGVLREVPLVVISGVATDEIKRRAFAAGADAVLKKPFRSDALVAQLEALLAPQRGAARPAAAERLAPALSVLDEISRLPGLAAGSWRLASGEGGALGAADSAGGAGAGSAPDPGMVLAKLRSFAASAGVGTPTMAVLEAEAGKVLLVGQGERRGVVCLHLTGTAALGKARYLARKFLRALDRCPPADRAAINSE
jgi:CheY-like chemotaxis protein